MSSIVTKKDRNRIKHAKTRTGCKTCKIRKLKCDEAKPACLRCIKFLGYCDGYLESESKQESSSTKDNHKAATRSLLPRKQSRNAYTPILYRPVHVAKFRNEQEHLGFLAFRDLTISELSSLFPSSLWEQVILQTSQEEVFVHDAVIAVGALFSCERRIVLDAQDRKAWGPLGNSSRNHFALQHYGRAIASMQQRLPSIDGEHGLRAMLIGFLLIVCFEATQGNYVQCVTHAAGGHAILQGWMSSRGRSKPGYSRKHGLSSPAEDVIENELVQALNHMDLQIMQYSADPRPIEEHKSMSAEGSEAIRNMPSTFINADEARAYLQLIERRAWHFMSRVGRELYKMRENEDHIDVSKHTDLAHLISNESVRTQRWEVETASHTNEILPWLSAVEHLSSSQLWKSRE